MRSRLAHSRHNAGSKGSENGGDGAATWKARKAPVHGRRDFGSTASLASKDRAIKSGAFGHDTSADGNSTPVRADAPALKLGSGRYCFSLMAARTFAAISGGIAVIL